MSVVLSLNKQLTTYDNKTSCETKAPPPPPRTNEPFKPNNQAAKPGPAISHANRKHKKCVQMQKEIKRKNVKMFSTFDDEHWGASRFCLCFKVHRLDVNNKIFISNAAVDTTYCFILLPSCPIDQRIREKNIFLDFLLKGNKLLSHTEEFHFHRLDFCFILWQNQIGLSKAA